MPVLNSQLPQASLVDLFEDYLEDCGVEDVEARMIEKDGLYKLVATTDKYEGQMREAIEAMKRFVKSSMPFQLFFDEGSIACAQPHPLKCFLEECIRMTNERRGENALG